MAMVAYNKIGRVPNFYYLDESGDLGFDFVNKRPSKFFTVCIVVIEGITTRKRIIKIVKRTLRKKLNPKSKRRRIVQELKATATTLEIKKYFYKKIEKEKFSIYAFTLNKRRVYEQLSRNKSRIYNWIAKLLIDNIDFSPANIRVDFVIDKSKSKPEIAEFNRYIATFLEGKIDPQVPLHIKHEDSRKELCLNTAELFAWEIFRKYERHDYSWYNIFKDKVKFEDIYLK